MDKIKKNFGFGCMRFPMIGEEVDEKQVCQMVDYFLEQGFNYFDTAHGYISGKSELAIKNCLTSRHPRESYILTDKLTGNFFEKEEDIRPLFESQLERCGVEYFDFYLMHAQNVEKFEKFKKCHAYETALKFKEEGKIRHFGISFHDRAEVLDQILTEYPQVEVVQLQFNYIDYDDPAVQSGKCYEVCRKHGKPVIVMEPVRGGSLANLSDDAKAVFDELHGGSPATYAIRYAAGFPGIMMVLSGMSTIDQMKENLDFMKDFRPLDEKEAQAVEKVCEIIQGKKLISCTGCRYCVDGCPKKILIPDLFACMNAKKMYKNWNSDYYYEIHTKEHGKASDCIKCGKCKAVCPYDAIAKKERPCKNACGVGAIVSDKYGRAYIDTEKCVSCGMCMVSCPFGAISDKSQIFQLTRALQEEGSEIIAEIAPAFVGQFGENINPRNIKAALIELGFKGVHEVALGADIGAVAEAHHYVEKVVTGELPFLLTSCCPSWAMLAKKFFPDLIDQISQELTPMVATARSIKKEHPNAKVVFIGPCAAKKLEASRRSVRSDVDFVVTFEELQAMFDAKEIDLSQYEAESSFHDATGAGRGYACAGGVAEAIEKCINEYYPDVEVSIEHAEGLAECKKTLTLAKAGRLNGCLIEGMGCPGGCIAGAGTNIPVLKAKKDLAAYVKNSTTPIPPKELEEIELE